MFLLFALGLFVWVHVCLDFLVIHKEKERKYVWRWIVSFCIVCSCNHSIYFCASCVMLCLDVLCFLCFGMVLFCFVLLCLCFCYVYVLLCYVMFWYVFVWFCFVMCMFLLCLCFVMLCSVMFVMFWYGFVLLCLCFVTYELWKDSHSVIPKGIKNGPIGQHSRKRVRALVRVVVQKMYE